MAEVKDPKIKLFGKTIQLPETAGVAEAGGDDSSIQDRPYSSNSMLGDSTLTTNAEEQESSKDLSGQKQEHNNMMDGAQPLTAEELKYSDVTPPTNKDSKALSSDNNAATMETSKAEENLSDGSTSQEKTLKKPDKILPCLRCNSMDTKFCYFNNYNVNQPRHFCRKCQRYWTAGGTIRNIPVGAGRRKSKNAAAHFGYLTVAEALQSTRVDLPTGIHRPSLYPNNTVLAFNSDVPLCESIASVLNIADKTIQNCLQSGFQKPEEIGLNGNKGNGDDQSSGSLVSAANSKSEINKTGLPDTPMLDFRSFSGALWPFPWNTVQWNSQVPPPAFGPAGFAMPFYPAAPDWGCAVPGAWNVSWMIPPADSPTLGKHSRDENTPKPASGDEEMKKESSLEKCLWVPKTLRIDDLGEAARSSIWAALGINNDSLDSVGGKGGLFKAFQKQSKRDGKTRVSDTSTVLLANPAALSRSINFHERS